MTFDRIPLGCVRQTLPFFPFSQSGLIGFAEQRHAFGARENS